MEANSTCCGCLNTDRNMRLIDDFRTKQCYNQIISEISINHSNGLSIWLCWECTALLHKFTRFKHQVLHSYKALQDYSKIIQPTQERLRTQNIINIAIIPDTEEKYTTIEETTIEVLKTEIDERLDVSVKEEDVFSNNDDDDDKALIEVARSKKKKVLNGRTKKRRKQNDAEGEIYIEVELSGAQLEEDRRALANRDEYVNAMFRCERCLVSFPNVDDLKDHVNLKHELNASNFRCPICECAFASEMSYNYHKNKHTRRYQCVICTERFHNKRGVVKHYEIVHCRGNDVEFDLQKDTLSNGAELKVDQNQDESTKQEASFPCEFCAKTFRWKTSLRKHVETHRIETGQKRKPYCEPCKLTFTTTSNLQKHVKTSSKHQIQLKLRKLNESLPTDPSTPSEAQAREQQVRRAVNGARAQHACPHCGARYQWRGNLLRHLHTHAARAKGELVCTPCNRTFSSIATYQQHMKISKKHVSENDFKFMCSECGKRFANKTRLKDHVDWEHLKNYVHTCQICQKVFKSHTSLYLHKQVVHTKDNAEHLCDHCGKPFPNQAKLRSHITALHSGEAPYRCSSCAARFSWHSCLSRHVRRVHRKRHLS
ncbi:uncharacterized protein [Epargyreus clarus]|uniref:uncharacterized protein n=1 Tax=Epargyreus clarus TaxID=520877 RepID=UPI003C2FE610